MCCFVVFDCPSDFGDRDIGNNSYRIFGPSRINQLSPNTKVY